MAMLLVVLDGAAGRVNPKGTALELAKKPFIDSLARDGACGMHWPVAPGYVPGSEEGHLALFGYEPLKENPGRGLLEALGIGIKPKKDACYFRGNFATLAGDGLTVIDRRAGRNDYGAEEVIKALEEVWNQNPFGFKVKVYHLLAHRFLLEVEGLMKPFPDTDPEKPGKKVLIKDELAKFFHEVAFKALKDLKINKEREKRGLLPINGVLLRGGAPGSRKVSVNFEKKHRLRPFGLASAPLYLGVARYVGIEAKKVEDHEKLSMALNLFDRGYDFVFVHFKATDIMGHDGKLMQKAREIEKIDELLKELESSEHVVIITSDHATPWQLKRHSSDPVPFLIYGGKTAKDRSRAFTEKECSRGIFGFISGKYLLSLAMDQGDL